MEVLEADAKGGGSQQVSKEARSAPAVIGRIENIGIRTKVGLYSCVAMVLNAICARIAFLPTSAYPARVAQHRPEGLGQPKTSCRTIASTRISWNLSRAAGTNVEDQDFGRKTRYGAGGALKTERWGTSSD